MAAAVASAVAGREMSRYLGEIRKFALLSAEEEFALARRWRERQDPDAAHRLVNAHLRLVAKIARCYGGYGLPIADLISEGNVGMMQAVQRFDPDRGFRLATYAMWWIRAAMQEYILHNWSLVKLGTTGAQKKLFFNLRRIKGQMQAIDNGDLAPEQVAKVAHMLAVPEQDVVSMNRRLTAPDHSLNTPMRAGGEGEWQDWLIDEAASQESAIADREEFAARHALLPAALRTLNARQLHIVTERWLSDDSATLEALSHHYGVSRERIRQIEMAALKKLRAAMGAPESAPGSTALMQRRRTSPAAAPPPALPLHVPSPPPASLPAAAIVPFPSRPGIPAGASAQRGAPVGADDARAA